MTETDIIISIISSVIGRAVIPVIKSVKTLKPSVIVIIDVIHLVM
jgi:hypothetical protein